MALTISGFTVTGNLTAVHISSAAAILSYSLFTWGGNGYGQLGDGSTVNKSSPVLVGSPTNWSSVSAKTNLSGGIKSDGTLWMWGKNAGQGGLGLGDTVNRSSPTQVGALTNWLTLSAGSYYAAAIKTDGSIWAWGTNAYGKLGIGNTTYYSSPKQIGSLTTWSKVSAGGYNTAAIKTDGTLWMWGYNAYGQLGQGNTTHRSSPVQVGALTTWSVVSCGAFGQTEAIKTDGTLWCWGNNNRGQLGLGDTTNRSSPVQIGALTNWLKISAGHYHNAAIKTDGTLWTWGFNYGRLGLGNTTAYSSPMQVGALTTWSSVSSGTYGSTAIKTDGTLWVWSSYNTTGLLGQGDTTTRYSPVQVGSSTSWAKADIGAFHVVSLSLYS